VPDKKSNLGENLKCRRSFKSSGEDLEVWLEISNRQLNVERSAGNLKKERKIEKFSGQLKLVAGNPNLPLEI